ncbi:hypothetical protein I7I48_09909 [Histoplasma ohiense]|nr:hypothetical protein I7I48_09909 [Histoplasma ohiense (nom. inval.)]
MMAKSRAVCYECLILSELSIHWPSGLDLCSLRAITLPLLPASNRPAAARYEQSPCRCSL